MKKIFILFLLCVTSSYAQSERQTPEQQFQYDRENNKIQLYFIGGIVSRVTDKDGEFVSKYKVGYHDFGCTPPPYLNEYRDYNLLVLNFLKEKHGNEWEKDIRKDILGWDKWMSK